MLSAIDNNEGFNAFFYGMVFLRIAWFMDFMQITTLLEVFMIKYLLDGSEQRKLQKVFDTRLNHTIFLSLAKES